VDVVAVGGASLGSVNRTAVPSQSSPCVVCGVRAFKVRWESCFIHSNSRASAIVKRCRADSSTDCQANGVLRSSRAFFLTRTASSRLAQLVRSGHRRQHQIPRVTARSDIRLMIVASPPMPRFLAHPLLQLSAVSVPGLRSTGQSPTNPVIESMVMSLPTGGGSNTACPAWRAYQAHAECKSFTGQLSLGLPACCSLQRPRVPTLFSRLSRATSTSARP